MSSDDRGAVGRPRSPDVRLGVLAALGAAALAVALAPLGPALEPRAQRTAALLVLVGGAWMTEALPVAVTALAVPVLGVLLGIADARAAFGPFGDPIVFLFFGTFLLTTAAYDHGLDQRLARGVLGAPWVAAQPVRLLWVVAFAGCAVSAFVNNTATTALLLPLALTAERCGSPRFTVSVLLAAAYAPSLGGVATPVGTAPNLIGLRLLEQATGTRPSFVAWCTTFAPLAVVATLGSTAWLRARVGSLADVARPIAAAGAAAAAPASGASAELPWSRAERTVVAVCGLVLALWVTPGLVGATAAASEPWAKALAQRLPEAAAPMLGALALFVLPARAGAGAPRVLDAGALGRVDWGTLLLFGGGLSLGSMLFESGLARAIGDGIFAVLPVDTRFGIVLAATLLAVGISEVTSNTASAALVVPVVIAVAQAAGADPTPPVLAAIVGCSFGFMLPVSTPPNALVYGTGRVSIRTMIANGVVLDVVGALAVAAWVTAFV